MKSCLLATLVLVGLLQNTLVGDPVPAKTARKSASRTRVKRALKTPAFDPTSADDVDGDDLVIRRAAVDALGPQNGSVVVADPSTGRILTIVNQKLAFTSGYTPCSTIKLVTSVAALTEHVIEPTTFLHLSRYLSFNLTTALAHSNNQYFANLGTRLGFDRVIHYAQILGLGEKAGLDIQREQPGELAAVAPKAGGMGMLTAFGEGFHVTPLELTALVSVIANGGTLYYLQWPRSQEALDHFAPQVKHPLELDSKTLEDIKLGMRGAVDYGTARRASDPGETILGKTGTCTDFQSGNHMGWFGSFKDDGQRKVVVVVMLTSPVKSVNGGAASAVAGAFYRNLASQNYFVASNIAGKSDLPDIITTSPCCSK